VGVSVGVGVAEGVGVAVGVRLGTREGVTVVRKGVVGARAIDVLVGA
jgi:hypothetical protein